jgi:hypothetical protein
VTPDGRTTPEPQAARDEVWERTQNGAAPQPVDAVFIAEPVLPADLKGSASGEDRDWNARALEALAKQLTAANDFYNPLIAAAQELRDLRSVQAALIELLRTFNPNSKSYARFTHDRRSL